MRSETESQEVSIQKYTGIFAISSNTIEGYFNVLKSRLQKKKGLTYDELVKNVKDVLDKIPIHIIKI